MTGRRRLGPDDGPDRLYTVTGGRSRPATDAFDVVTLIVAESAPVAGMQSEHARILRLAEHPIAVVELSAELGLPVSVIKILLGDLLEAGRITARHPRFAPRTNRLPDVDTLKQVLHGLQRL
ncbi:MULTISPECIES: DUF742 domain-containing protein [Kitasatospora]|uniref:DUF742 domain-containing protein n=1 Tax=Kitasatospora acidiphila TaxID=2567942 RepID=A0A540W2Q9_9ACTN|nr:MULTISPECIES: DUF742 domain-containing protein [Kitasatospora]MDH6143087.1 hypothetical protein [Kitasatospora sp. GP30]TQF03247.1 DUF742 domain-containing protein [Kitasatospora acidiphila]